MSIAFNDTTNFKGLVQIYEKEIGANRGDVSGDSNKLKELTADINLALDDFIALAIRASGTWQYDDSNHTDYPIITTNLVDGQRDYSFTVDDNSTLILDIYKVLVKASSSAAYVEIKPVDVQTESVSTLSDGLNTEGTPYRYDKTANGIFLDPIPSANVTAGLKVYINREGSYFTSSDTTKMPGVPGLFHRYFAIRPAEDYARRNTLTNFPLLQAERMAIEEQAREYFGARTRDERKRFTVAANNK